MTDSPTAAEVAVRACEDALSKCECAQARLRAKWTTLQAELTEARRQLALKCRDCGAAHVVGELELVRQAYYHPGGEDCYYTYNYVWFCLQCPCTHAYPDGTRVHAQLPPLDEYIARRHFAALHTVHEAGIGNWSGRPGLLAARALVKHRARVAELELVRAQAALLRAQAVVDAGRK